MITFWKIKEKELTQINDYQKGCWIDASAPDIAEINWLVNTIDLPEDFISDILDTDERPRRETEDGWKLILIRIPVYDAQRKVPYFTVPYGILWNKTDMVTMCLREHNISDYIIKSRMRNIELLDWGQFILNVFLSAGNFFLEYLKRINVQTGKYEVEMQKSMKNKDLQNLMNLKKCMVFFLASIKSDSLLLEKLSATGFGFSHDKHFDLIEDVLIDYEQALQMAKIYDNILSSMLTNFSSMISNSLNIVMKQLTSATIILMLPTLIASIYGMNIKLPFANDPYAYIYLFSVAFFFTLLAVLIFRLRNLF